MFSVLRGLGFGLCGTFGCSSFWWTLRTLTSWAFALSKDIEELSC